MADNGVTIHGGERIDDLGRRGYRVIQNPEKFCFGVDAVLLAWFAEVRTGESVLDIGTGTGIVPLLMDARYDCGTYTGLDIQPEMIEMANRSCKLNGVTDHIQMVAGDLKETSAIFGKGRFDVVTTNPPYMKAGTGIQNPDISKNIARHEILMTLDDLIRESAKVLKDKGRFYMVHRPSRLPGILEKMSLYHLAPEEIKMVHPSAGKEATMVLVSAVKGGKNMVRVTAPLFIYEGPNTYSQEIKDIYGDGRH